MEQLVFKIRGIQKVKKRIIEIAHENVKTRKLNKKHYQIIQDIVVGNLYTSSKITLFKTKILSCLISSFSFLPLIEPSKKWKILFDCYCGFLLIFRMFIQTV